MRCFQSHGQAVDKACIRPAESAQFLRSAASAGAAEGCADGIGAAVGAAREAPYTRKCQYVQHAFLDLKAFDVQLYECGRR